MKSAREFESLSVGVTTMPQLDSNASGTVSIMFLIKADLIAYKEMRCVFVVWARLCPRAILYSLLNHF